MVCNDQRAHSRVFPSELLYTRFLMSMTEKEIQEIRQCSRLLKTLHKKHANSVTWVSKVSCEEFASRLEDMADTHESYRIEHELRKKQRKRRA